MKAWSLHILLDLVNEIQFDAFLRQLVDGAVVLLVVEFRIGIIAVF